MNQAEKGIVLSLKSAEQLRTNILNRVKVDAESSFKLAEMLYQAKNSVAFVKVRKGEEKRFKAYLTTDKDKEAWVPLWVAWGYNSWGDYLRHEAQMTQVTADFYLRVWNVWGVELANRWDKKNLLPIGKMHALTHVALTTKRLNELLKKSRAKTAVELKKRNPVLQKKKVFSVVFNTNKKDLAKYHKLVKEIEQLHGEPLQRDSLMITALEVYRDTLKERPWLIKVTH